jgi:transposase, IS30 family
MEYQHLSLEEREKLYGLRVQGKTFRAIGLELGRSHTTLIREWHNRAKYGRSYLPCKAQALADKATIKQRTKAPLKNPQVFLYVRQKLRRKWSPETIAGRLPLDHPDESIHFDSIYRYIYNSKKTTKKMKLWKYLALHRKRRMKKDGRKVKPVRYLRALPLKTRPAEVATRQTVGHWETDNLGGKVSDKTTVSGNIERKSRYTHLSKLQDKTSLTKMRDIKIKMKKSPPELSQSLTIDNGPENAKHSKIATTFSQGIFSCNPYHSWEKGSVENMFGRVRRFIPKGTSLDIVTDRQIKRIEYWLNHTPRKCLGFKTPYEIMQLELELLKSRDGALQLRM